MGGKTHPPEMAATRKEPPRLVCRPRERRARVKIVAKQQDSKQKTRMRSAMDVVPVVFIAATAKTKHRNR